MKQQARINLQLLKYHTFNSLHPDIGQCQSWRKSQTDIMESGFTFLQSKVEEVLNPKETKSGQRWDQISQQQLRSRTVTLAQTQHW